MKIREILGEANRDVAGMQPDTVVTVFHGTDVQHAMEFCTNGIDARQRFHRLYPHYDQNEYVNRGLFVTTNIKVAISFGSVILKFKVLAKNLFYMYPSPKTQKHTDQVFKPDYPKSFRPSVSYGLLGKQNEQQALFRGLVSPRAIEKVYLVTNDKEGNHVQGRYDQYQSAMAPDEFIKVFSAKGNKQPYPKLVEPQQVNITPDQFLGLVVKAHPSVNANYVDELIRDAVDPARHKTFQSQILGLMNFSGGTTLPYTAAKRLLMKFLARYGMQLSPNPQDRMVKGPHFG